MMCVTGLLQSAVSFSPATLGFRPHRQCADVFECVRMVLRKGAEWDRHFIVSKQDVHKAFDSPCHDAIDSHLARKGVHLGLRLAVAREFLNISVE
eukprot:5472069-Alexandrium_andersonii.AAC.1